VGGTSLATPIVAAAANLSYPSGGKTGTVLQNIYRQRTNHAAVRDITAGQAGSNVAMPGRNANARYLVISSRIKRRTIRSARIETGRARDIGRDPSRSTSVFDVFLKQRYRLETAGTTAR
jgi:hypothetical protein